MRKAEDAVLMTGRWEEPGNLGDPFFHAPTGMNKAGEVNALLKSSEGTHLFDHLCHSDCGEVKFQISLNLHLFGV